LVNNYILNQRSEYQVPYDLINKTLIVHCASRNDKVMREMFDLIDDYKIELGFKSMICSTVDEIRDAVNKHKPELLIFDCHGSYDKDKKESYLIIDDEKGIYLKGDDIIKQNISAPIVFLSACSTMPNYGFVKFLSDAFMQIGSLSVTEASLKKKLKLDNVKIAEILTKTMMFGSRIEALEDLRNYLKENGSEEYVFNNLDNEWLSYSTMGRPDLLYFTEILKRYRDKKQKFHSR